MKLFQYAVLWHPNAEQKKEGKKSEVIMSPTHILASDQNAALMIVARAIPENYLSDLSQVEIAIRPF